MTHTWLKGVGHMAGGQGFEPWLLESESRVLPLNYPPIVITPQDIVDNICTVNH